ncbi:sugar ABC transporter permease [Microbacterium ulmi]|uniref:Sugar ABC transporter permease n=1 Tax=Microbacterium ulmi TaxID=179095 RepID=A0A7Y2Q191_9MICO|nr:sugar ABC transporter permease [Microbacterium ulmi]
MRIRPWLWILPAIAFVTIFLVYPAIATVWRSLFDRRGDNFVGLDNYGWFFGSSDNLVAIRNNILWAILLPLLVVGIGLLVAVFAEKVRYEVAVRSIIFLPMAISAVAAGVIWRLMYDIDPRVGTLNAVVTATGGDPVAFLSTEPWNNVYLIIVGMWMMTGLAVVVLVSGLKGVPLELLEAARLDGANEWRVFWSVIYPLLRPTIAVVTTTVLIFALKTFDVVFVMTNGNFGTEVMANKMYKELFSFTQEGRAATVATVLFLATVPLMVLQVRRFRQQEEQR